jgi:hypothetical protein
MRSIGTSEQSDLAVSALESEPKGSSVALRRQDFLGAVVDRLRSELPVELADFHVKSMGSLVKIYYGNERVHFEIMTSSSRQTMEIGLHFEDGPASTVAYLAYFDQYIVELKHRLGPSIELERWTESWGHIYEIEFVGKFTDFQADRTAKRLAELIAVLQPLVDAAGIPTGDRSAKTEYRGRWSRRKR